MNEIAIKEFLIITSITIFITGISIRKEATNAKIIYIFIAVGVYLYSGLGICFESVDNKYMIPYFTFLLSILVTIRIVLHLDLSNWNKPKYVTIRNQTFDLELDVASDSKFVKWMAILFILTLAIYLFIPTFRPLDFFVPRLANIVINNIYEMNAIYNSNIILKLANTLNIMCLPFYCLYIQEQINIGKKKKAVGLVILWFYLEFLQKNYLGRYKLVIYFVFVFALIYFVKKEGLQIRFRRIMLLGGALLLSVPLLYSFIDIRSGGTIQTLSFGKTLGLLLESEIYYPTYYRTCSDIFQSNGSLGGKFVLYVLCLPIPSILFPGKPTVNASQLITYAVTGKLFGAANYSSTLPSVIGEAIIIWGESFVWLHGIVMGIAIGIVFKYLMRYKSLTVLYVYYAVSLLIIGRGGAESYLSGLINGTICLIVWVVVLKRYRRSNDLQYHGSDRYLSGNTKISN